MLGIVYANSLPRTPDHQTCCWAAAPWRCSPGGARHVQDNVPLHTYLALLLPLPHVCYQLPDTCSLLSACPLLTAPLLTAEAKNL